MISLLLPQEKIIQTEGVRQADGVLKAKDQGKYKGRPENVDLHKRIQSLLDVGKSYSEIQFLLGCSRHTISKVKIEKIKSWPF